MLDFIPSLLGHGLGFARSSLTPLTGADSGLTWVLAVVVLTIAVRALLLPLNILQFRTAQRIQALGPKLREVADRSKASIASVAAHDPADRLRQVRSIQMAQLSESRKMRKEARAGFAPLLVPALVQGVLGVALFHLVRHLVPGAGARFGLSSEEVSSAAAATISGSPLATSLLTSSASITALGGDPLVGHAATALVIVLAVITSTIALRHSMSRANVPALPDTATEVERAVAKAQESMRRVLPRVMPVALLVAYVTLPLGLLVSILVVAVWTLVYQRVIWNHHDRTQERVSTP